MMSAAPVSIAKSNLPAPPPFPLAPERRWVLGCKLRDSAAVATGAASGIGLAIAYALANRSASLVLAGRRGEALNAVAAECRERGVQAFTVPTDVTDEAQV